MNKKWMIRKILRTIWIVGGLSAILWVFYSYQSKGVDKEFLMDSQTTT